MLDTQIKTKWLEALRSGKYAQGIQNLRSHDDQYCCLGVLCDVLDPTAWELYMYAYRWKSTEENPWTAAPPDEIWKSLFVGEEVSDATLRTLWDMNDHLGKSFEEIADWIEINL